MQNTLFQYISNKKLLPMGMGTWNIGNDLYSVDQEVAAIQRGLDLGIKIIDTAEMYGDGQSERTIAKALKNRREEAYLVSKVLPNNASYEGVLKACDRSLKNLDTEYIDLYLLHWQGYYSFQETIDGFEYLKNIGKIKAWGVSNMDVKEMNEIQNCEHGMHCQANQVLYNLTRRGIEYDLIPWQHKSQMPVMAYSPMEQGRLLDSQVLKELGKKHSATASQLALAWILRDSMIIPIPKTSSVKHMEENFKALEIKLDEEDFKKLDSAFPPPAFKTSLQTL
ncbi:MAG TPA: aldo/keto reductase [Sphingobacterium sp.]|nr:aldo/keto reductase [Sphingobacterium sp.]